MHVTETIHTMRRCFAIMSMFLIATPLALAAEITVSAATSLTGAFTEIGRAFERNSGHKAVFNFGASGSLLQQIASGAPVDVFAAADLDTMDRAEQRNLIDKSVRHNFASNKLMLVVPRASSKPLASLTDLTQPQVSRIAIGNPDSVPVGRYARAAVEAARIWEAIKPKLIYAQNARQCLDYVRRAEVDASFVFASDVLSSDGAAVRIAFEVPTARPILYPIAPVRGNAKQAIARAFIEFLRASEARSILVKHGFGPS